MATLRIVAQDGSNRASLTVSDYTIKRDGFNVLTEAEVAVARNAYNSATGVEPGVDEAYVELDGTDIFGGILRSANRQGSRVVVKIRGKGQYLKRAETIPTGQHKVAVDDSTLIEECVDAASELTKGIIETVEPDQTWVFGGISPWKKATKVANAAGGELQVMPNGRVHYVRRRGRDKTDTTLSPDRASFVEDTFTVSRDGVQGRSTHLHVTGVGQGSAQIEVAVVPESDTANYPQYDRVERYHCPIWGDGDPPIWESRSNKDLKNEDAAAAWATKIAEEMHEEEVRVKCRVKSDYVGLGDSFHVYHSDEGVDDNLRAVEVVEHLGPQGGRIFETVFSNYEVAHLSPVDEQIRNSDRYGGGAYEGDLTNIQQGPGRGPVGPDHDYVLSVFYPEDVVSEVNAQLHVKGLNYRAYSEGSADNGDLTQTAFDSVSSGTTTISANTWNDVDTFTPSSPTSELRLYIQFGPASSTEGHIEPHIRLYNSSKGTYHPDRSGHPVAAYEHDNYFELGTFVTSDPSNTDGEPVTLQFYNNKGSTYDVDYRTLWTGIGRHNHQPDPGILDWDGLDQSPQHYPDDVDVVVNGTALGANLGDGSSGFSKTVDLQGQLTAGWNEIRLTSASLGHLDATFSADLFRQSL